MMEIHEISKPVDPENDVFQCLQCGCEVEIRFEYQKVLCPQCGAVLYPGGKPVSEDSEEF